MKFGNDIFWIGDDESLRLAIVLRPRGGDWLEDEIRRLRRNGIDILVSLLENQEAAELGLSEEAVLASQSDLAFHSHPIPDREVPSNTGSFRAFASQLAEQALSGKRIGVHCRASIGRATILAACVLVELGWDPNVALTEIKAARECHVPDTPEQRDWILRYEAAL
jgi:protein-tyrosine phosphatase